MHDIHTHLYWDSYDADRDAVITRAHAAGIETMFTIGCTVEESQRCIALAEKYPEIYASIGIHPHEFRTAEDVQNLESDIKALRQLVNESKKVIAVGECGLDYYVRPSVADPQQAFVGRGAVAISDETKAVQRLGFLAQITLAQELELPLIIHCRDAYEDVLGILRAESTGLSACILHCYMGDTEVTRRFLELENVYFSFTANITYPVKKAIIGTKDDLCETVRTVPPERIFVETDCPFLAPQSKRGERNEPAFMQFAVAKVAELQGMDVEGLERRVEENFRKVFTKAVVP
ncbi:MAG: TatD family deoxyribonuclease [Candidatus Moraniibacteriota bacterium]|nr:MAG: TatD family deoxyribonuclease [Candidatus Moranbacteria bacterium]